jgi:hypothetical protein
MSRKPTELPPAVARAFVKDMRAFLAERNAIKRDEIAARQLHALKQHYTGKLWLFDVKEMFLQMKDHAWRASILAAGGSAEDFRTGIDRAIALGWLWRHESGTYVKFTDSGAALFAWRQVHLHGTPQNMMVMDMKPKQRAKATAAQLDKSDRRKWPALIEAAIRALVSDAARRGFTRTPKTSSEVEFL